MSVTERPALLVPPGLQNYSIEEAADLLRCFPRFLSDNLRHLPHQKLGAAVAFDGNELLAVKDLFRVRPVAAATGGGSASVPTLASITPSLRRKRA